MSDMQPASPAAAPLRPRWVAAIPPTRDVLAVLSTLMVAGAYFAPWARELPKDSGQYVGQMQGAILMQWALVMSWYFGSSKSSSAKDDTIAAMAAKPPAPPSE